MNRENLKRMADYIRTIEPENFSMRQYREENDLQSHKCNSIGDTIGHCTILDKWENIPKTTIPRLNYHVAIDFTKWSMKFTGFNTCVMRDNYWCWCFSERWVINPQQNTPEASAQRIEMLLDGTSPVEWDFKTYQLHETL